MRVRIVGGPGSGKTYLAKKIAELIGEPYQDLDDLFWDNNANTYGIRTNEKKRDAALAKILVKKNWVVEGVYGGDWVRPTFEKADRIIILKPRRSRRTWRIVKRFALRKLRLIQGKKETLKNFYGLLKWNHGYDVKNLARIESEIAEFKKKTKVYDSADAALKDILRRS